MHPIHLFIAGLLTLFIAAAIDVLQGNRLAMASATEQSDGSVLYPDGRRFLGGKLVEERDEDAAITPETFVSNLKFLAPGAKKSLADAGKNTVQDLLDATDAELIAIKGVSEKSVEAIREQLSDLSADDGE